MSKFMRLENKIKMASEPGVEEKDILYLWDPALTNISAFKVVLTAPSKCRKICRSMELNRYFVL